MHHNLNYIFYGSKNKFDLLSVAAFNSPRENNFKILKVNTGVKDYGLTFHLVADYDSKILRDKLDPPSETLHALYSMSNDPDAYYNNDEEIFQVGLEQEIKKEKVPVAYDNEIFN